MNKKERLELEEFLIEKGFESTLQGFRYIVEYFILREKSPGDYIAQGYAYETIGKMYGVKKTSVERCIRHQFDKKGLKFNKKTMEIYIREWREKK